MFNEMLALSNGDNGSGTKKVVTGSFTHNSGTTNVEYTISGLNKIDFIVAALGANTLSEITDSGGAKRIVSTSNTGYTSLTKLGSDDYKISVYASNYYTNGLQKIDGNKVTFNHWNSTSQTVAYYAVGS